MTDTPSEYTPTTEDIRAAFMFALSKGYGFIGWPCEAETMFDRWLAAHDADRDRLAQIVDEVRALHAPLEQPYRRYAYCEECECDYPCSTSAILSGEGT